MRIAKERTGVSRARERATGRIAGPRGVLSLGIGMLLALGLADTAFSQSPFTGRPSTTGDFTLPENAPPSTPRGRTRPSLGGPSRPGAPLQPMPGGTMPGLPGERTPVPPPFGASPFSGPAEPLLPLENPSELPLPLPGESVPIEPVELPPKPAVAPPLNALPTAPIPKAPPIVLKTGLRVTLRISQLLPVNGLSPGERLLNSQPAIQVGDCFLAEIVDPCPPYPILVGGTVSRITPPGRFGKPGYVKLQMLQIVRNVNGQPEWLPWRMDTFDRRFTTRMRRIFLTTLLGLEGAGTGASIGSQFSTGNMAFIGGGMGIGALVGLAYASFQRGTEAYLEPGDTFEIVVGSTDFRPVSREWQTILYPAAEPPRPGKHQKP